MKTFDLKVVASNKIFFEGECSQLIIPIANDGMKGFLANHENVVAPIEYGEIKIDSPDGERIEGFVGSGYVEFHNNSAIVVCISAELPEEIDERRATEAAERAQEQLRQEHSLFEYHQTQMNLARAMERLKLRKRHGK